MATLAAAQTADASQVQNTPEHDKRLQTQVWRILAGIYPLEQDRRHQARFPYPRLMRLAPLSDNAQPTVTVIGKHLSEDGMGFFHNKPLPDRQMLAHLELPGGGTVVFHVVLRWCRFICDGWYESGAKLVRVVSSPEG